jgi:hypothetical protein
MLGMDYDTEFEGRIYIEPPLSEDERKYLNAFSDTRRMKCEQGPYYVERGGYMGQEKGPDVRDFNTPPEGQPSLWCQWVPTEDGSALEWNGDENFIAPVEWMQYLIEHFLQPNPLARQAQPEEFAFLQGHELNGLIRAQGEVDDDQWTLFVTENRVGVVDGHLHL